MIVPLGDRKSWRSMISVHLLGMRLYINSSGMFALSPKRISRIEDKFTALRMPWPGSGPGKYLARMMLTKTNKITRNVARDKSCTRIYEETRPSVRIKLSPRSCFLIKHSGQTFNNSKQAADSLQCDDLL